MKQYIHKYTKIFICIYEYIYIYMYKEKIYMHIIICIAFETVLLPKCHHLDVITCVSSPRYHHHLGVITLRRVGRWRSKRRNFFAS